jgi:hypothetical protein
VNLPAIQNLDLFLSSITGSNQDKDFRMMNEPVGNGSGDGGGIENPSSVSKGQNWYSFSLLIQGLFS